MTPENDSSEQRGPPGEGRGPLRAVPDAGEPPFSSAPARRSPGPLPVALTSFVGREREVSEVGRLLTENRLVTLSGPGGSGKTRLAMAAASLAEGSFESGAAWVWLAPLSDASLVARAVVSALGLDETPGRSPTDALLEHFDRKEALLVLDNCEHLVGACAGLVSALISTCPRLRVLATSREPLGVEGEMRWPVPPLSLPDELRDAGRSEAARLFVERASRRVPDFALTPENAGDIAEICVRLEGMPLAIELAAARIGTISPAQISDRLDDCLRLLGSGPRTAEPRQRTLRGALEWSHDLLPAEEKTVLRRLSAFSGGWTLEAAEAVCSGSGVGESEVLDLLGALVDKSLVLASGRAGEVRYRMLATVRQYAREKLDESGEEENVCDRHARFFLDLAEAADLTGSGQTEWMDRLEVELDNLRAALRWYADRDEPEANLRLAGALWWFCYLRGHYEEGRAWLEGALEKDAGPSPRAGALTGAGVLALLQCDYERAEERLKESLSLYRELGNRQGEASATQVLGSVARERGLYDRAEEYHEKSLALWRELGDESEVARSLNYLGFVAWLREEFGRAVEHCTQSLAMFRRLGDAEGVAWALIDLGSVALYGGDRARAEELLEESLAASQDAGYREGVAWSLDRLGLIARRGGDPGRAESLLRESLKVHRDLGDRWRVASVLEGLAGTASDLGRFERSALLFGAAEALREAISAPVPPCELADLERGAAEARDGTDEVSFRAAYSAGGEMSLERVCEYALEPPPEDPASGRTAESPLSEREVEVLALVAEGLTDGEIAGRLYLSRRTVGHHLGAVYRKLGVPSRAAAVKEADERGLI